MTVQLVSLLVLFGFFLLPVLTEGHRYPSARSRGYRSPPGARTGRGRGQDCPVQCRCISLSLLGYRDMAQRWESMGQINGNDNPVWKGTESPVWQKDAEELQGRAVVCMGLAKIPRPLPTDATKLTMYGDSSDIEGGPEVASPQNGAQLTVIRDYSFQGGGSLKQLTISGNNVTILYPYIFRGLTKLENIAMQNNNIRHISAATFYGLHHLIELRLSDNMIAYLSPHVFNPLTNLRFLYLNGNKLRMLHRGLFNGLDTVEHLDISRNNFTDFYDTVFDGATNLRELLINENRLWVIRARWFRNLAALTNLEIRGNLITQIDPSSFSTLLKLEQLSLSANIINTISNEAFRNLTQLKILDIAANDINRLEPDCFAGLESLDGLDLSVNRLSFIDNKTFVATPKLTQLDLSKNSIKDIEEAALHSLESLQELDLSYNKLKKIRSKTFSGLLSLKEVNLERNLISEIEDDAFVVSPLNQLSMVTWLSLQYNKISELTAYSLFGLPHMKFLNIGHNRIQTIHKKSFNTLTSLKNLLLNNNRLRSLEDGTFSSLKQLYSLTLEGNKLSALSDDMFLGLASLDDLNLVLNAIDQIAPNAFRHFPKLTRLNLKTNKISSFNFNDVILLKNLGFLDISNNRLYTLQFTSQKTHDLRHLILTDNNIRSLSSDVTNVMSPPSGVISLANNPLLCDCHLGWIQRYLAEYRIRLVGRRDTRCQTPSDVHGHRVDSLAFEEFRCNNRTTVRQLSCDYVQLRDDGAAGTPLRKGKNEAKKWHVTFQDTGDINSSCNGLLLSNNWVVTRQSCMLAHIPSDKTKVKVKVGQKTSREILFDLDYPNEANDADFDIRLVRLAEAKKSKITHVPCILTHAQYHSLAISVAEVGFTVRLQDDTSGKFKTKVRTGRILSRCEEESGICVKVRGKPSDMDLQGSPLSLRYQGIWYLAGLGVHVNATDYNQQRFTPLWSVSGWMETAVSEIDTKCQFQEDKNGRRTLCEGLEIPGVIDTQSFK